MASLLVASSMLGATGSTYAADLPSPAAPPPPVAPPLATGWTFEINAYGWASGLTAKISNPPPLPTVKSNVSFGDLLTHLTGAFMGAAEARYNRFAIFGDLIYSGIAVSTNPRGPLFNSAKLDTSMVIGTLAAGYRVTDNPLYSIDAVAGIRGVSIADRIETGSFVPALNLSGSSTTGWVDPIVGVKARFNLTDKFYLTTWDNIGGFGAGSKLSWDVFGGLGYAFNAKFSGILGYRAIGLDYSQGNQSYLIVMQGPIAVISYRF